MVGGEPSTDDDVVALSVAGGAFWDEVFVPAPLVLVATTDEDGRPDLAPKHQATPLGWQGWFGFACTERHRTHGNARRTGCFTVSYPVASHVVEVGQSAAPRVDGTKGGLALLPTRPATVVAGVVVAEAALWLECELERVVQGFGEHDLLVGRVVHAAAPRWAVRGDDIDDADLVHDHPMLVYLCPSRFAAVKESWSFPFPAEFRR